MALVAYDDSDISDTSEYEDTNDPESTTEVPIQPISIESKPAANGKDATDEGVTLFNFLPKPSQTKVLAVEADDEFLHKKAVMTDIKPKTKITVPSLSDFKDVGDSIPSTKPKLPCGKKSGLLSILPQPKNSVRATTKSLIPNVLSQKSKTESMKKQSSTPVKKKVTLPSVKKEESSSSGLTLDYSDESDVEGEVQTDFFSINKKHELPIDNTPLDIDMEDKVKVESGRKSPFSIENYFKAPDEAEMVVSDVANEDEHSSSQRNTEASCSVPYSEYQNTPSNGDAVLDDEAIRHLCGTRGKRKREEIQIVDVNQQEVLADAREWLLKGLMDDTTKRVSSSKKRGNEPTHQQKRKHQITYLAHQAKANEAELQNQWANNRMSKRQTQSKYGF